MNFKIIKNLESGYSIVLANNKYGIVDKDSNIIQEPKYDKIGDIDDVEDISFDFENDDAFSGFGYDENEEDWKTTVDKFLIPFIIDNKIGWFNQNYAIVINPCYEFDKNKSIQKLFFVKDFLLLDNFIIDRFGNNCIEIIKSDVFNRSIKGYETIYFKEIFKGNDFRYDTAFERYIIIEYLNETNLSAKALVFDLELQKPIYFDEQGIYFNNKNNSNLFLSQCLITDFLECNIISNNIIEIQTFEYDYTIYKNGNVSAKKLSFFEITKRKSLVKVGGWLYKNKIID